jgi:hypothetical protein
MGDQGCAQIQRKSPNRRPASPKQNRRGAIHACFICENANDWNVFPVDAFGRLPVVKLGDSKAT